MNNPEQKKKLIEALISLGFTEAEGEDQIVRVGNLATAAVMERILRGVKDKLPEAASPSDLKKAVDETYSPEALQALVEEEALKILKSYFEAITANLGTDERELFYGKVGVAL